MEMIYLDSNATSQPAPSVVDVVNQSLTRYWANASSVHRMGQEVRREVDLAREQICRLIGCSDRELVITCGGTEADNLAIRGSLEQLPDRNVVVSTRIEHSAVRQMLEHHSKHGIEPVWLPLLPGGVVDVDALRDTLQSRADEIALVTIQWTNNETGVIQPIEDIGMLCREHGVRFHTDATQWIGKVPVDLSSAPVDMATFSAHKFHGPKGVGGLFVRRGVRIAPQFIGGGQERERRAGTLNVPGIQGMGEAARLVSEWFDSNGPAESEARRNRFERAILDTIDETRVNSGDVSRLWSTSNIAFHRLEAEAILLMLSERGVCASAGAACSSGSLEPSPILLAMGIDPEWAHGSVRFSLSRETTDDEIDRALDIVTSVIGKLRASLMAV